MKIRVRVQIKLFRCRNCGKQHNNPITHVCVFRARSQARKRKTS